MILVVDSGSTKCDWLSLNHKGEQIFEKQRTRGLNPAIITEADIIERLNECNVLKDNKDQVSNVFFYGAGCGTEKPRLMLKQLLSDFFVNAQVSVKEDTYAAVYSTINTTDEAAVVCILGTGSNCSYYDGSQLIQKVESLGYTIMDDAAGDYFGRQLIRDYYFSLMPKHLKTEFAKTFNLNSDHIKANLYKQPNPNAFLASYAEFMFANKNSAYVTELIKEGMRLFTKTMIMQYKEVLDQVPVHFAGSIAYLCREEIIEVSKELNFKVGNFARRPIEGLVKYHINNLN